MGYIGYIFGLNFTNTINKSLQKVTKSIEQEHKSELETTVENISTAVSTIDIEIGETGTINCAGNLTMNTSAESTAKTMLAITQMDNVEFDNDLFAQLKDDIETEVKQENEGGLFGPIADANIANTITETLQENENSIKQTISSTLKNSINQDAEATGELKFKVLGTLDVGGDCVFDANSLSESIASVISDKVNEVLLKNSDISELDNSIKTKVDQKNLGIDPMVAIAIAILIGILGVGGGVGTAFGGKEGKILSGLLFMIMGGGLFGYSFFIDKSCENDMPPSNASECLDEKDDEKDDIKCKCPDTVDGKKVKDTEYEKRGWFYYLCLIGGPIFAFLGIILLIWGISSSNESSIERPLTRRYTEPNIGSELIPVNREE